MRVWRAVLVGGVLLCGLASPAAAAGGPDISVTVTSWPDTVSLDSGRIYYGVNAQNVGTADFKSVILSSILPAGAIFNDAESSPCWAQTTPTTVSCDAGALAVGASTSRPLVIRASVVGTITTTVTSTSSPKDTTANSGFDSTTVLPGAGTVGGGYLITNESITIDTNNGVHRFTMPTQDVAKAATTLVSQAPGNFCGGPCASETIALDFPLVVDDFNDPAQPGHIVITFDNLPVCRGLGGDCRTLYHVDAQAPNGVQTPFCDGAQAGKRGPGIARVNGQVSAPCINEQANGGDTIVYDVLVLSSDPGFGGR
jgi:hypothetical protein